MPAPVTYRWDGEAMQPLPRFHNVCNAEFVVGETYTLDEVKQRSQASHRHYFAAIHTAWLNLPETIAANFPSEDHLRKFALIRTGYRDERSIACASKAEAQRVAAFIKPMDDYALVVVNEAMVTVYTAKTQKTRAMGAKEFQASKEAVLDYLAGMIGTNRESMEAA